MALSMPGRGRKTFLLLVALTAINASYLAAFDSATIFYHVNVIAHVALGVLLAAALLWGAIRALVTGRDRITGRFSRWTYPIAALVMAAGREMVQQESGGPFIWRLG